MGICDLAQELQSNKSVNNSSFYFSAVMLFITLNANPVTEKYTFAKKIKAFLCRRVNPRNLVSHSLSSCGIWQRCGSLSCILWCYLPVVRMQRSVICTTPSLYCARSGAKREHHSAYFKRICKKVKYLLFKSPKLWMKLFTMPGNCVIYLQLCSREVIKENDMSSGRHISQLLLLL